MLGFDAPMQFCICFFAAFIKHLPYRNARRNQFIHRDTAGDKFICKRSVRNEILTQPALIAAGTAGIIRCRKKGGRFDGVIPEQVRQLQCGKHMGTENGIIICFAQEAVQFLRAGCQQLIYGGIFRKKVFMPFGKTVPV